MSAPAQLNSRYYLDHFDEMVAFVRKGMGMALNERTLRFLAEFEALSLDARCLYVRLANRKGRIFWRERLVYEEIGEIPTALDELKREGFVRLPQAADWKELLLLHTRSALIELFGKRDGKTMPASRKKREVVATIERELSFDAYFLQAPREAFLVQERLDEVDYLFFLYYGRLSSGLTALALRDLGLIKQDRVRTGFRSRFSTREAAEAAFTLQKLNAVLECPEADCVKSLAEGVGEWPLLEDPETELLYHRAIYRLGRELERLKEPDTALRVYAYSDQFPATERHVRLLVQLGERAEAQEVLVKMIDDPSSDAELLFAEDFYERKFQQRKVGKLTSLLREARVIAIDESNRDRPEAGVIAHLEQQGYVAFHSENLVWNQLFGLLFWNELFEADSAPVHNEFERKPWGLDSGVFYTSNQTAIERQLQLLDQPAVAAAHLREVWLKYEGAPNALVSWFPGTLEAVCRLVECAPLGALAYLLRLMASDHRSHRSGFPDLLVFKRDAVKFMEVKTEGDKISRKQLTRLEQLRHAGFDIEVAAVRWNVDPEQEYVVVDVETTGAGGSWNRVTEIGAVRVKGGRVLDEWSTLVNPERRIPQQIVRLTGITDEMVSTAPRFAEIAEAFRDFVGQAVFVAHRVKFDYGVLRSEYHRMEQDFFCPTFCTVVMARRVFPGLKSYGLASLTEHFDIALDSHHRALCDAKATAEILRRINERRLQLAAEA